MAKINAKTTGGGGIETVGDASAVLELQSAGTTMATISPSGFNLGSGTPSAQTALSPYTGFKNRIINGAMQIDQRNAGAAVTVNDSNNLRFPVDRTAGIGTASAGVFTLQQLTTSLAGFNKYIRATVTTTASSLASSNFYVIAQNIEGFNTADFNWGTADATAATLSFWVRSSVTGTFGGSIRNSAANRAYPFSYTITSAGAWEQKIITIPGDTTGTWLNDNGIGIRVTWALGVGTDRAGTAGAWNSTSNLSVTGATNLMATNGATFDITGVQLEVGTSATSFEYRDYGRELIMCQRYYYQTTGSRTGTTGPFAISFFNVNPENLSGTAPYPVTMRASPTVTVFRGPNAGQVALIGGGVGTVGGANNITTNALAGISGSGLTGLGGAQFDFNASAEL